APAAETRQAEAKPKPAPQPLGGQAAPIDVPPLDQTDQIVRELVKQVTSNPRIAAWLATDGLIRNFTVGVANVAEGTTPAGKFGVLRPRSAFETTGSAGSLRVAPRSYERYNDLTAAMASIDPAGAARLYATLKPRIEEAYRDLGYQEASFDRALEKAIVSLLQVPATDPASRVEPRSASRTPIQRAKRSGRRRSSCSERGPATGGRSSSRCDRARSRWVSRPSVCPESKKGCVRVSLHRRSGVQEIFGIPELAIPGLLVS